MNYPVFKRLKLTLYCVEGVMIFLLTIFLIQLLPTFTHMAYRFLWELSSTIISPFLTYL